MTVDVELTRTADAPDLARSLAAQGFETDVRGKPGHVLVSADDVVGVEHALEDWTAERGLPFVPYHLDEQRVVLCPPGS